MRCQCHDTVINFVSDTPPLTPVYSFGLGFIASVREQLSHFSTLAARDLPSGDDADFQSPHLSLLGLTAASVCKTLGYASLVAS